MMSLYLKALEGEQSQLPPRQHLLPELKYNIMCGNSLIGRDIYDQGALFADEERDRINAFDWNFIPPVAALYDRRYRSKIWFTSFTASKRRNARSSQVHDYGEIHPTSTW